MEIIKNINQINAEIMRNSYLAKGKNTAGFIVQQTKLFQDNLGHKFKPYEKQVHFMNLLRDQDKIITVLKPRQCITGDSLVLTPFGSKSIKQLFQERFRDLCYSFNNHKKIVKDIIIDIWEAGIKDIYEVELNNGYKIKSTLQHKFHTLHKGYLELSKLKIGDNLVVFDNSLVENSLRFIFLELFTYQPLKHSSIKSIKYIGKEMTYDLTTEKYHNYFANGINVHNSGFSTSIVGKVVYESYFNVVPEICVVSATKIQANKVLDRIRDAFKSMHPSLQPEFENENAGYLKLKNGCKIYSLSSNPNSARGFTGNVYLDEFAILSMKISYELWSALYPSITHGGRIVTVSTPKGKVGKFFELCSQEIKEDQKINKIIYKINWRDIPFIVDGVKNKGLFEGLSQEDIEQEYELTFLTDSEEPYFSKDFIMDNYIDVDGNILLYNDYEDLGIPDEYFKDLNKPLEEKYIIAWNKQISHLLDNYSRFVGAWDIASTNDDSIFKVAGQVRGTDIYHIIGEFLLNKVSTDTTEQAKYIKRVISCFNLESLCTDYKGLGRGVVDFLCASDGTSYGEEFAEKMDDIIIKHETTLQNKIDLYSATKQAITSGKRKRRYDGSKYDNDKLKQFSNVYLMGGKLVKKNGKDDYADCESLLTRAIEGDVGQDGIIFLEKNKIHYGARNDGSSIFPRRS